ncbi:TIGR03089 family protein [Actinomyces procaprae]|uniref:TIGR03089 family protein n=1 Tax=Actinomyces procaprae TaxID=2560010 RepID=UPI0010A278DB|nr:TIGR03089 family protein [Actinomyces procaprae]
MSNSLANSVADSLAALLPSAADADRPWLVWYAPGERVELTGRVLHMWQCKIAGLLMTEASSAAPAGPLVHLDLGVHWRTLTWCGGVWLVGGAAVFAAPDSVVDQVDISVAFAPEGLHADAEVQVLVPREPLARRWPGALPPLVLDGVADVMPHPDSFTAGPFNGAAAAIVQYPGQAPDVPVQVSRDALAADPAGPRTGPARGRGAGARNVGSRGPGARRNRPGGGPRGACGVARRPDRSTRLPRCRRRAHAGGRPAGGRRSAGAAVTPQ